MEQPRHPCSGHPNTPGSKKARYTTNCGRPSNKSGRLTLPLGPSNSYFLSTASQGIRRRAAAMASRARVNSFSLTSSCWRAASHSCDDTTGGVFMFLVSMSLSFLVVVAVVGLLLLPAEPAYKQRSDAARRCCARRNPGHGCHTHWAHG